MNNNIHLWLRSEMKKNEYRTPITPIVVQKLITNGYKITVEKSTTRCFIDDKYKNVGCELVEAGTWMNALLD